MPWTPAGFKIKHAHHLTGAQAKAAAEVANKVLADTNDEGRAVREGIAAGEKAGKKK
ncbi:MAG: hypothetical protein WAN11_25365 [Syntrophobacteraceae bacterium]